MKQQILIWALAAVADMAVESVEDMKEHLIQRSEGLVGYRLIRWTIFGWKIRWSVRRSDVERIQRAIRDVEADNVRTYILRLAERLA